MPPSLHARLIKRWEIAYRFGKQPRLWRASPVKWALACHEMFETGRIDLLEYAARRLHKAYPELDYLTKMVAWFDAIPRHLPPPLVFTDSPAAEVQIVHRASSDAVLLCFCAQEGTLGLPLNFVHQWLGRLPVSLVYIKDLQDTSGALGFPSIASSRSQSIAALRAIAEDLGGKRIYTLGVSAGGYAAMYYGLHVNALAVLNLAGATDLTRDFVERLNPVPAVCFRVLDMAPDYAVSLREPYAAAKQRPHLLIAFNAKFARDRAQAERMAGLPNVELIAVDGAPQHNVVDPLIRAGQFLDLLHRLLAANPAEA